MKVDVKCKCGHTITMTLYDTNVHGELDRKIKQQEERVCPECYHKAQVAAGKEVEVEVKYYDYKNNEKYMYCKSKADSYNKATKTIVIYMPVEQKTYTNADEVPLEKYEELQKEYGIDTSILYKLAKVGSKTLQERLAKRNSNTDDDIKMAKLAETFAKMGL